jgi:ribosome maturation factor RimP
LAFIKQNITFAEIIWRRGAVAPLFFLFMIDKEVVKKIVEDFLKSSENYPVAIEIKPDNSIVVEIDNDKAVSIDDCIALSSYIESKLDREKEDYALEVGSTGLGQAFKIQRQYLKHVGKGIEVLVNTGVKYTGILKAVDDNSIVLTVQKQIKPEGAKRKVTVEEDLTFLYNEIKNAKYSFKL